MKAFTIFKNYTHTVYGYTKEDSNTLTDDEVLKDIYTNTKEPFTDIRIERNKRTNSINKVVVFYN